MRELIDSKTAASNHAIPSAATMSPKKGIKITNKIEFPLVISFGSSPLCELVTKIATVKCNLPTPGNLSFSIEVLQPHPYFKITPLKGEVNNKTHADISITFTPITLGTCSTTIKLFVNQPGFLPIESTISACAVSGMLECKALQLSESRIANYLNSKEEELNSMLGSRSTYAGSSSSTRVNLQDTGTYKKTSNNNSENTRNHSITGGNDNVISLKKRQQQHHVQPDPTAMMLASTFKSTDVGAALDSVIADNQLLGSKIMLDNQPGVRAIAGILKGTAPIRPRGPGSGNVYDVGGQWMSINQRKAVKQTMSNSTNNATNLSSSTTAQMKEDKIVEGLRIPPSLDSTYAVNFVITQEPGKLKPKDLKLAIERNRQEKEQRAEEQMKMRVDGGGAGMLDLRGILAEERLNLSSSDDSDPFKRQLREMAFLADVDDVDKAEKEKEFRVSDECIGSALLTDSDVNIVMKEREKALLYQRRSEWRKVQARQITVLYPPTNTAVKAGASNEVSQRCMAMLKPSFDPNRNDIWSKRMNTLRRFIALVSRWLLRNRVDKQLKRLKQAMAAEKVIDRQSAREWIDVDNATYKSKVSKPSSSSSSSSSSKDASDISSDDTQSKKHDTVIKMVCTGVNKAIQSRIAIDTIVETQRLVITKELVQRNLFPIYEVEEGTEKKEIDSIGEALDVFDDMTYFPLKVLPEYERLGYDVFKVPASNVYFPMSSNRDVKHGAMEERVLLRPSGDNSLTISHLDALLPTEPPSLATFRTSVVREPVRLVIDPIFIGLPPDPSQRSSSSSIRSDPLTDDLFDYLAAPDWLSVVDDSSFSAPDINFFAIHHELRCYTSEPRITEMDDDWTLLRTTGSTLDYQDNSSLRSKWMDVPGFLSVQKYLLASHETICNDPIPAPGPTLIDFYLPDSDRHISGLNCFYRDHLRSLAQHELDVLPMRKEADAADHLSDSESDDDESYAVPTPSMALVRKILKPKESSTSSSSGSGISGSSVPPSPTRGGAFGSPTGTLHFQLSDEDKNDCQVELLRDRKVLDLESHLQRVRYDSCNSITRKLSLLSSSAICRIQSLPVQLPFNQYEDDVYREIEESNNMPVVVSFVENNSQ